MNIDWVQQMNGPVDSRAVSGEGSCSLRRICLIPAISAVLTRIAHGRQNQQHLDINWKVVFPRRPELPSI